jgi:hypothetical protein
MPVVEPISPDVIQEQQFNYTLSHSTEVFVGTVEALDETVAHFPGRPSEPRGMWLASVSVGRVLCGSPASAAEIVLPFTRRRFAAGEQGLFFVSRLDDGRNYSQSALAISGNQVPSLGLTLDQVEERCRSASP